MESKLVEGLYFAGEVLDIVGRRGGYNFNFAWASGMIAGKRWGNKISVFTTHQEQGRPPVVRRRTASDLL